MSSTNPSFPNQSKAQIVQNSERLHEVTHMALRQHGRGRESRRGSFQTPTGRNPVASDPTFPLPSSQTGSRWPHVRSEPRRPFGSHPTTNASSPHRCFSETRPNPTGDTTASHDNGARHVADLWHPALGRELAFEELLFRALTGRALFLL